MSMMNIAVAGIGYVGLSNAVLLAQKNHVIAFDVSEERVTQINSGVSPIVDRDIEQFLREGNLHLTATCDAAQAFGAADYVIVATPTNYDPASNYFDTSSVEAVIDRVRAFNREATIVVKSTIPVGFIERVRRERNDHKIFFSPEFLREGQALHDNLYPSRIVVGDDSEAARRFAQLLVEGARKEDISVLFVGPGEAEATKLFANTYLALRVAYFNELDSYAMAHGIDTRQVIEAVCLDPRIGGHYNNPSFGYGGYCLPKDSKQLLANFSDVPQNIIRAVVDANDTRMDFLTADILSKQPKVVGIYRLAMKHGSDNFRESSIQGIMKRLAEHGVEMVIFEPDIQAERFNDYQVLNDFAAFKQRADVILANRASVELQDVSAKVYTRDVFQRD